MIVPQNEDPLIRAVIQGHARVSDDIDRETEVGDVRGTANCRIAG